MRAAVYHGPLDVRVESRPTPTAGPGEVLLAVSRSGICGTDASEYDHGPTLFPLTRQHPASRHLGPMVMGHEFIGTITGGDTTGPWSLGDRVATGAGVSCGRCRWCRAGRTNLCREYWTLGLSADGGLAEYAAVPVSTLVRIPADCTDDSAALAQPLAVGLHAVRRAGVQAEDTVVLIGAGAIGSFALCGLAEAAAARVIVLDVAADRLETARTLGATDVIDVSDQDPTAVVAELTAGTGAQVVIEASGRPGGTRTALALAARGGRVLQVGLPPGPQPLDVATVALREVDLITTVAHVCAQDLPQALDLLTDGSIARTLLHSIIGLDELVPAGLEPLSRGAISGKILIDPRR